MSRGLFFLLAVLSCGITVAADQVKISSFGLVAKVNGVTISSETFERNFEEYLRDNNINVGAIRYPQRLKEYKKELLDMLINAELVWQAAQQKNIVATEMEISDAVSNVSSQFSSKVEFRQRLSVEGYTEESYQQHVKRMVSARKYLDEVGANAGDVAEQDIHAFYVENPDKFRAPELVRAQHILLQLSSGVDNEAKQQVRNEMEAILKQARTGADFAQLARQYSQDASAANGGDLGYFPRGRMVKPFEDTAFELNAGEISDIVETQFGFHIIKVIEHRPAGDVPETMAQDQIRSYLQTQKQREVVEQEVNRLRAAADIEVYLSL